VPVFSLVIYKENTWFWVGFSLPIIPSNKFDYQNVILLVLFKKIKNLYYICYIVDIFEKDKYSFLQYESAKYILSILIILIKIS